MQKAATPKPTQPPSSKTLRLFAGAVLGVILFSFLLFDPLAFFTDLVNTTRIRWELPAARERWYAQDISSYQVDIKGAVPLSCILDGELTVEQGELVRVRMRTNPLIPDTPLEIVGRQDWQPGGCAFQDLTIAGMFQQVERQLQNIGPLGGPLRVSFDPQLGYIREYHSGRAAWRGLLGASISDCCTWFEFDNLEVVSP